MSQTTSSDILMKFVHRGVPIAGESQADPAPPGRPANRLMKGFVKGRIVEINSFTFSLGVQGAEPGAMTPGAQGTTPQQGGMPWPGQQGAQGIPGWGQPGYGYPGSQGRPGSGMPGMPGIPAVKPSSLGMFKGWRSGGQSKYPVSVQPITFTRAVDRTSTQLLHCCIKSDSFDSVTLVKRKAAGGGISGEPYLRLDFSGVLFTDIAWSNADPAVTETCKFISRAITVQYRPQLPDGSLGAILHGFYSMNPSEREVIL